MNRRLTRLFALGSLAVLTACGSGLSHDELLRANTQALRANFPEAQAGEGSDAPAASPVSGDGSTPVGATVPGDSLWAAGSTAGTSVGGTAVPDTGAASAAAVAGAAAGGKAATHSGGPKVASPAGTGPSGSPAEKESAAAAPDRGSGKPALGAPGGPGGPGSPAAVAPGAEIVLGSFGQESGPLGAVVVPILQAAKAWVNDVNARGGAGGHPVRLISGDDGGEPGRALALAKRMVEQDKVVAFYAVHSLTTLQAVTPYLEQRKVPVVGACECNPAVDQSPMVFHPGLGATTGFHWGLLAPLLEISDKRKLAVLYCREVSTCSQLNDGVKKTASENGVDIVYTTQVSLAQPDFTAEVISARNAGAEAITILADNPTIIRAIRSAHRQGWNPLLAAAPAAYDTRFLTDGGADVEGAIVTATAAAWSNSPAMADYRAAMNRYAPNGVRATLGAEAWVSGKLIEKLAATLPAQPQAAAIIDALYGLRGETLGGAVPPIAFERDKGHSATNQCVVSVKVEKGAFVAPTGQFRCRPGWKPVGQ